MKKNISKKTLGFLAGFVLSTSGFMLGGFSFMQEAMAAPRCPGNGQPNNFQGFRCVNGNCQLSCDDPSNSTCADLGSTCLMGFICTPLCPG